MRTKSVIGVVFVVFFLFFNAQAQITAEDFNKIEKQYYIQELHDMLEDVLETDLPVESITQAIDQFAHGEFDKAKNTISEEAAKQIAGFLLGSTGGSIVGYAWDFAKYSLQSVQSWGKNVERRLFLKDFLLPCMERWKASRRVDDIRTLRTMFDQWFDDNRMRLGRTEFFKDRDKWIEQLKFEMWSKTLEVNTKYRKYFLALRRLQAAAKQKQQEIRYLKWKARYMVRAAVKKLRCANEAITINNIRRFMEEKDYKTTVLKVCAINKASNSNLTIADYERFISLLERLTYKDVVEIMKKLSLAGYEANLDYLRLFVLDGDFRRNIEKASKKATPKKSVSVPPKGDFQKLKKEISDVPVYVVVNVITQRNFGRFRDEIVSSINRDIQSIKKQLNSGSKTARIDLGRYVSYLRRLKDAFIDKNINYRQYLSANNFLFGAMKNNILPYVERKEAESFISKAQDFYNQAKATREKAEEDLKRLNKSICEKDDMLSRIKKAKREIDTFSKNNRCKYNHYLINELFRLSNQGKLSGGYFERVFYESMDCLEKTYSIASFIAEKEDRLNAEFSDYLRNFGVLEGEFEDKIEEYLTYEVYSKYNMHCIDDYKSHIPKAASAINKLEDLQNYYLNDYDTIMGDRDFLSQQLNYYKTLSILVFEASKKQKGSADFSDVEKFVGYMKKLNYLITRALPSNLDGDRGVDESQIEWIKRQALSEKVYHKLSYYESLKQKAYQQLNQCKHIKERNLEDDRFIEQMRRVASKLKLWPSDLRNAYNSFMNNYRGIETPYCSNSFKSDFESAVSTLEKLKFIEIKIKNRLDECIAKNNAWACNKYLGFAKALPFKPSFNISDYEERIVRMENKQRYFAPPKITTIKINGHAIKKWSAALYPYPINIEAYLKPACNLKKCYPKKAYINCGAVKSNCTVNGNLARCTIKSNPFVSYCSLTIENYSNQKTQMGFTIDYEDFLLKAELFLRRFARYYSEGRDIRGFLKDSDLASAWVDICSKNRANGVSVLSFGKPALVSFRSFEDDPNFIRYSIKLSIPWRVDGKIKKSGTATVTIINKFTPSKSKTYSYIANVEGDSFFMVFEAQNSKNKATNKVKTGYLTHAPNPKFGGYSLDFETGRYKNSEEDIASGYVNPKVPQANKPYFNVGQVRDMGAVPLESVKACPKTGYTEYYAMTKVKIGHTYCIRTKEGHFAKVYITNAGGVGLNAYIEFRWVYSPDGKF